MPAVTRNITIDQGATFVDAFGWRADSTVTPGTPGDPISLAGATLRMQIRKKQGDPVILEATSPSDGLSHDGVGGNVSINLPPSKTNLLTYKSCRYDIEADFGGDHVEKLVEGSVTVRPNITQEPGEPVLGR